MAFGTTLARAIETQLARAPDLPFLRYLQRGEVETACLSGADIDAEARRVAAGLRERGLGAARLILIFEAGPGFLHALVGCLYAGAVAIPAPAPRPGIAADRLQAIAGASGAAALLTSESLLPKLAGADGRLHDLPVVTVEALGSGDPAAVCPGLDGDPQAPAIVQYTSGSTGAPRGVVLTSACILDNIRRSSRGMDVGQTGERELLVNWMPHHHDMGLIGMLLTPLVKGLEAVQMAPLAFVQRPARWLEAIHRYRARTSGAPAFAYDLCAERIPEDVVQGLDLACWEVAFCGAEPVFAATLDAFRRRFAPARFAPRALFACYGLAETSLYAAGGHFPAGGAARAPTHKRAPCRLDKAARDTIRIVDAGGAPVGEAQEGEIWIASASVAAGYLDDDESTAAAFRARLDSDDGGEWLRTGDLGIIVGDVLTVTGRIKDVVIRGGINVAAADIERLATDSVAQLNPHGAAAFEGPDEAGAPLVLLVEQRRAVTELIDEAEVIRRIRRSVFEGAGVTLDVIRVLRPGALPRTTSGKIRRADARALWLDMQAAEVRPAPVTVPA